MLLTITGDDRLTTTRSRLYQKYHKGKKSRTRSTSYQKYQKSKKSRTLQGVY